MQLAKVIGTVVAEQKHAGLVGVKLLVIQPHDHTGAPDGPPIVAADALQAGPGDTIQWVTGREAALALPVTFTPVDCSVVAIVDEVWSDPNAQPAPEAPPVSEASAKEAPKPKRARRASADGSAPKRRKRT
jgi:ethanolamine utilization protein EutN